MFLEDINHEDEDQEESDIDDDVQNEVASDDQNNGEHRQLDKHVCS